MRFLFNLSLSLIMKLSIIVPIYNVAPYLRKCVDSLLQQDYDNYEIILVDDGSTDGSGALADSLATSPSNHLATSPLAFSHSPKIRVIHQPNQGLSGARNTGIKAATGEYIEFLDSDDYLQPNMIGRLMAQIERDNLDILRFKYQHVRLVQSPFTNDHSPITSYYEPYNPYKTDPYAFDDYSEEPTDGLTFLNERMGTACYAAMFVLRRSLLINEDGTEKNFFTPDIYFEDTDWLPRVLMQAKRVASTHLVYYCYLMREGSITHAVSREKQQKLLEDKMKLVKAMIGYKAKWQGGETVRRRDDSWFDRMIAATVVSICGMLAGDFWSEKRKYLSNLSSMHIYPLCSARTNRFIKRKIAIINLNANIGVCLLHLKNTIK